MQSKNIDGSDAVSTAFPSKDENTYRLRNIRGRNVVSMMFGSKVARERTVYETSTMMIQSTKDSKEKQ